MALDDSLSRAVPANVVYHPVLAPVFPPPASGGSDRPKSYQCNADVRGSMRWEMGGRRAGTVPCPSSRDEGVEETQGVCGRVHSLKAR